MRFGLCGSVYAVRFMWFGLCGSVYANDTPDKTSNPKYKDDIARFSTVPLKALFICVFLGKVISLYETMEKFTEINTFKIR